MIFINHSQRLRLKISLGMVVPMAYPRAMSLEEPNDQVSAGRRRPRGPRPRMSQQFLKYDVPGGPVLRSPADDRNAESSKVLRKFNFDRVQKCQKTDKIVKFDRINQV